MTHPASDHASDHASDRASDDRSHPAKERPLAIAQVNTSAGGGGAERIARQLHDVFLRRGHESSLIIGRGEAAGPGVIPFPGQGVTRLAHAAAGSLRILERRLGLETYRYPATHRMLDALPREPDIVHLHNLHGGYFDLRVLPELSRRHTVVLTLHDAWLLSGHCAHSLGCERWRTGCGSCPDLGIYPAVRRDATARNWRRKQAIFRDSRLHVATPSHWLAERVQASMLAPAVEELRVIHNGVDVDIFEPGDQGAARSALGLPATGFLLLFVGSGLGTNPFKDFATALEAAGRAAELLQQDITLLALGGAGIDTREGRLAVRHVAFEHDATRLARVYQACDVYVHAARADTFPTTVLEALACGRPVVATAVGGITEQVRSLAAGAGDGAWPAVDPGETTGTLVAPDDGEATGMLVAPGDADAMARAISRLLEDAPLRARLGVNAARDARRRFDARDQAGAYLEWYRTILGR